MNYLAAHWHAQQSFKQAFIVNTIVPLALLLALQHMVFEPMLGNNHWLRTPLLVGMTLIYATIIVMGIVSVNRTSRISQSQTYGAGYSVMACNSGLFMAACVIAVNLLDIPTTGIETQTTTRQAFEPVLLSADNHIAGTHYLHGAINPFTPERLEQYLADNPDITTLVLASDGGHVYAARAIAKLIQRGGLNTHVDQQCFSSCTLIYVSGAIRTAAATAEFGFHGYRYNTGSATIYDNVESQQSKDAAIFEQQGVSDEFIEQIFAASPHELWKPSLSALRVAGVINTAPGD
ncbi:MAG: hypothetical protein AAF404_08905 [Pseudomonadota bacterium]